MNSSASDNNAHTLEVRLVPKSDTAAFPWEAALQVVPHLLWITLLLAILLKLGRQGLADIFGRVQKVGVAGVEIEFKQTLEAAASERSQNLSAVDLGRASRRLARDRDLIQGARLLWIDDQPNNNRIEIGLLEGAGARVDTQTTSTGAQSAIDQISYDLIVSDIERGGDKTAGMAFATALSQVRNSPPMIFYVGTVRKPVPAAAFGITNRPDELVHLVLDILARKRS